MWYEQRSRKLSVAVYPNAITYSAMTFRTYLSIYLSIYLTECLPPFCYSQVYLKEGSRGNSFLQLISICAIHVLTTELPLLSTQALYYLLSYIIIIPLIPSVYATGTYLLCCAILLQAVGQQQVRYIIMHHIPT